MANKEITLLKKQLNSLNDKNFDLEGWKNHTVIFLERIFGSNSSKIKMIKDLRYDYSSWNLRDTSGADKTQDPVRLQATEIIEAIILELEQLGLPEEAKINEKLWSLLEDELTGKQVKEIEKTLNSDNPDKVENIKDILDKIEKDGLSIIIARLLIS